MFRMTITDTPTSVHEPRENEHGDLMCPACQHADIGSWANDGEADLADWWECDWCGHHGAMVLAGNHGVTQNGIVLADYFTASREGKGQ